jgi:hypothetical protein
MLHRVLIVDTTAHDNSVSGYGGSDKTMFLSVGPTHRKRPQTVRGFVRVTDSLERRVLSSEIQRRVVR